MPGERPPLLQLGKARDLTAGRAFGQSLACRVQLAGFKILLLSPRCLYSVHRQQLRDVSPSASAGESPKSRRRQNKPKSKSDVPDHRILLSRLQDVQNEKEQQEFRSVGECHW